MRALGTFTAAALKSGAWRTPEPNVLLHASDHGQEGNAVADLIKASGFEAVSVRGIDQSMRIEAFGDLHQFGKLGWLVTVDEAATACRRGRQCTRCAAGAQGAGPTLMRRFLRPF